MLQEPFSRVLSDFFNKIQEYPDTQQLGRLSFGKTGGQKFDLLDQPR